MAGIKKLLDWTVCKLGFHDWVHLRTDVDMNSGELWANYDYAYYCRKCRVSGYKYMGPGKVHVTGKKPMDWIDVWKEVYGQEDLVKVMETGVPAMAWDEEKLDELPVLS